MSQKVQSRSWSASSAAQAWSRGCQACTTQGGRGAAAVCSAAVRALLAYTAPYVHVRREHRTDRRQQTRAATLTSGLAHLAKMARFAALPAAHLTPS
jgi:hypothetical protein